MKNNSSKNILILGVGIAAGWVMKQLFDSPEGREKREAMKERMEMLRTQFEDSDEAARVKAIFGEVSQEALKIYHEVKEMVIKKLGELQVAFDEIDKAKYEEIVNDIVASLEKDEGITKEQIEKLKKALMEDYKKLQAAAKAESEQK